MPAVGTIYASPPSLCSAWETGLKQAGLMQAGLKQAGLKQAGLMKAGLMQAGPVQVGLPAGEEQKPSSPGAVRGAGPVHQVSQPGLGCPDKSCGELCGDASLHIVSG